MTIRTSLAGGGLAGAAGAAIGGGAALIYGTVGMLWLYAAFGASIASLVGWVMAKRRAA